MVGGEELHGAGDLGAEFHVGVGEAGGGRGEEDVGPAVEGVHGGEGGFEADEAVVGAEDFVTGDEGVGFVGTAEFGDVVVGVVIEGAVAVVGLGGVFEAVGGLEVFGHGLRADEAEAVGLRGSGAGTGVAGAVVGVEVEQVGVGRERADGEAGVGGVENVGVGIPVGLGAGVVEDAVDAVEVTVGERGLVEGFVLHDEGVEGLIILAKADVADETGVIEDELLASEGALGFFVGVGDPGLVEVVNLGVGDDGLAGGVGAGAIEVVFNQRGDGFAFDGGLETIVSLGGVAETEAGGEAVGVVGELLIDVFVAETGVEGDFAFSEGVGERDGCGGRLGEEGARAESGEERDMVEVRFHGDV